MPIFDEIQNMYEKRVEQKELKKMPSLTTMKKHARNLEKLTEHLTGNKPTLIGSMSWMTDQEPQDVINNMKTMKGRAGDTIGLSSQQAYMFSILVGVRVMDFTNYYKNNLYDYVYKMVNDKEGFKKDLDNHKVDKENVFVPEYNEVQGIVDNFIKESNDLDFKIILKIYTTFPFRLEVADLKFLKSVHQYKTEMKKEQKSNYIVKKSRPRNTFMFSFNDYKTADKYGERKIAITDKSLTKLLNQKQMEGGEFMFGENGMLRNTLSKKITSFFEKNNINGVNPTNLTKMVIKKAYDQMDSGLRAKQEELAKQRGHSVGTQLLIYMTD